MIYAIICEDTEGSLEKRQAVRPRHAARLVELQNQGRLLLAGPFPAVDAGDPGPAGFTGSLIVAEFETLEDAKSWIDADPFTEAGVYASITVKPLRVSFPQ
jgi:uncharacterized protein YciI